MSAPATSPAAPTPLSLPQASPTEETTPLHVARVSLSNLGL